jgi:hypothetical protein
LGKTCRTFETRIRKEVNKRPLLTTHLLRIQTRKKKKTT